MEREGGSSIALVLALAMREGEDMGMRARDFYLHHSREYIDRQEYFDNFEALAKDLIASFRYKAKK